MTYTFEAGPDTERYTVQTEYNIYDVEDFLAAYGVERAVLHGAIIMIQGAPDALLDAMVFFTGTGLELTLRMIHEELLPQRCAADADGEEDYQAELDAKAALRG